MYNAIDKNPINTNRMLKELQKEMKELRHSIRQVFREIRNRKKGENIHKYLSVAEVADLLNVHKSTVYRMIYAEKLPTTRFNRKVYVHESHILGVFDDEEEAFADSDGVA